MSTIDRQESSDDGLLTIDELAVRLKVKKSWIYEHAAELGAFKLGKYWRFRWSRVLERLERGM